VGSAARVVGMAGSDEDAGGKDGQNVAAVHDRLREAILNGAIAAGATTSQNTLARDLGTGRTQVREALRMLQREGLVLSEPNRRVRIAALSASDAEELYVMRIALEAVAIRVTVPTLTAADLAALEGLMAQMDFYMRRLDNDGLRAPHSEFHSRLVGMAGPRVTTLLAQMFDHAERYRRAFGGRGPEGWDARQREHRAILDAAAAGDPELAAERLVAHYASTAGRVFHAIDPGHDLSRVRTSIRLVAPGAEQALLGAVDS
jgi:DNA-binding GntR family transcriptional regulator